MARSGTLGGGISVPAVISPTEINWVGGKVIYVPLTGDIQAYVTAATAGDTLILGAGTYTVTATITVDKAILIKGQGLSATKVTTATPNLAVFTLTASTARVTDLYIGNTGTGTSYAIYAGDGLTQLQVSNVIAVLGGNGLKYGVWSQSSVTVSNSEMYITSADQNSNGVVIYNDSAATVNISANVQNVRVLATGATLNNRGVVFNNNNTAKTITGNVTNCNLTAYASSGATDIALYVQSTTTFNSTVNAYDSVLSGADSDVTVTGTNSCTLTNCTLVNGTTTGTIAYGGTQVALSNKAGSFTATTGNFIPATAGKGVDFSADGGNVFSHYIEYTAANTACTGAITTSVVWKATKIGDVVTILLPSTLGTASGTSGYVTYGIGLPVGMRPAGDTMWQGSPVINAGVIVATPGVIWITSSGQINVSMNVAGTNFTGALTAGLAYATAVSFIV